MMTNLFSVFDPSSSMNLPMNWLTSMIIIFIIPMSYWMTPSRLQMTSLLITKKLHKEMTTSMKNMTKKFIIFLVTTFWLILLSNSIGLMPYIFTPTSQIIYSSTLALPVWLAIVSFMLMKNMNHTLAHMIPAGTPMMLANFMVLIETISNIIRPLTLTIRLTANMISGHLLLTLLSKLMSNLIYLFVITSPVLMLLLVLELSVALIQAYVFVLLLSLYMND
nr:ATP synthase F0 subunit 6 [Chiropterargas confusus]